MSRVGMGLVAANRNRLAEAVSDVVVNSGDLPVGDGNTDLNKFDKPVAKARVVKKPAAKKRTRSRARSRA